VQTQRRHHVAPCQPLDLAATLPQRICPIAAARPDDLRVIARISQRRVGPLAWVPLESPERSVAHVQLHASIVFESYRAAGEGQATQAQLSPRQERPPSPTASAAIPRATTGSSHHTPNRLFASRPTSTAAAR